MPAHAPVLDLHPQEVGVMETASAGSSGEQPPDAAPGSESAAESSWPLLAGSSQSPAEAAAPLPAVQSSPLPVAFLRFTATE
jgi:hypothetical protein